MLKKIARCNKHSHALDLGTKAAALEYWPCVGESLTLLVSLLERLKGGIEEALGVEGRWVVRSLVDCMWFQRTAVVVPKPNRKGKNVGFKKEVRVRNTDGEGGCRDGIAALTNDRKRTAGTFKLNKMECEGKGSENESEGSGGGIGNE